VSQPAEVDGLVDRAMAMFGGVDILVNNAAIAIYRDLPDYTPEEWDQVLAVNLRGIFLASRRCMPIMAGRGGGGIVHIASVHARITATGNAPYVASKGAGVSLARAMALEGAPHKIRVNCILPGAIATPMLLENWGDVAPEQHLLLPRIPLGRFGAPDEIARVAQFLASDESSYMTGSDVLVDGGISAHFTSGAVMTQSEQRVAIVTGAAGGIGAATAAALAADGAAVVLADWQAEPVEQQARALRDRGYAALAVATDISRRAEVEQMVQQAVEAF